MFSNIMKFCAKCSQNLPDESFHRRGVILQSWCKTCRKSFDAGFYRSNKKQIKAQKKIWRGETKVWYNSLKSGPCADCGGRFHAEAMHWDHLPEFKKNNCLSILLRKHNKSGIVEEIKKCELVCANCHAVRTFNRRMGHGLIARLGTEIK